jgi:aminoglycoside/choline kinase family phosphotransferase
LNQENNVASRPAPETLLPWALSVLGLPDSRSLPPLATVAGDASHRRYFRFILAERSYVVVEAPPATEKNAAFLQVAAVLAGAGVKVPALLGADLDRGFLLLEDLGDELLLPALNAQSVDGYYRRAFDVLAKMAALAPERTGLGDYDAALLQEELSRFEQWFVRGLLGYSPSPAEQSLLREVSAQLVDSALEQPRVLVHRDFHSRNLMLVGDGELAVIDFQDAVVGPLTYDLVSLLRDCYVQWPAAQVRAWALDYRGRLAAGGLLRGVEEAQFLRWFDWMGLQRHIKVLGTFARLYLRDGKSAYLEDLPLVIHYVLEILTQHAANVPAFADFNDWFSGRLSPLIAQHSWGQPQ